MVEQFVFTFNGAYLKAVVNAYRQLVDTFVFHFTRENIKACVMSTDRYRLIEIVFTPYDYRAHVDEVWVQGDMGLLWGAVRKLKKADTVTVRVEDDKFYVGPVQPGEVVPEEWIEPDQKFDLEFPAYFEQVVVGSLKVVVADFKKILRSAPPDTTFLGFDIDEPGGHIILGTSILDIGVPLEWLLEVSGKAREAYTLDLFISLLVSGLIENAYIRITDKGHVIVEYAEPQCTVKLYMSTSAARAEARETITEILARPKPVRTEILRMWVRVGDLHKAVKAIEYLTEYDEVTIDPSEGLGLFWKDGYLKVPSRYLETWTPPPVLEEECVFSLADLVKHLKGVEDLILYYDAEKRLVLWGTGPKISPRELIAHSIPLDKVEVPKVEGKIVFTGPADLLRRTVEDAKVAEDNYLVFYTTPYEIEVFGRNEVYYEATFELNDFQAVEEDYVPINEDVFGNLIGFFRNVPATWCSVGKTPDNHVYLSCDTDIGEFRAIRTQYHLKEAIKAYEERMKRPVAPPEAEKLPEAPPPVAPPPVMEYPAEAWNILYAPEDKKPYLLEFNIRGTWNPLYFETFDELAEFTGKGRHTMYIHIKRGEGDVVWTPFSIPPFTLTPGDEIDTPEKKYKLTQPGLRSDRPTEWVWIVSVYDKKTYMYERSEMTEDEWRALKVEPPPPVFRGLSREEAKPAGSVVAGVLRRRMYEVYLDRYDGMVGTEAPVYLAFRLTKPSWSRWALGEGKEHTNVRLIRNLMTRLDSELGAKKMGIGRLEIVPGYAPAVPETPENITSWLVRLYPSWSEEAQISLKLMDELNLERYSVIPLPTSEEIRNRILVFLKEVKGANWTGITNDIVEHFKVEGYEKLRELHEKFTAVMDELGREGIIREIGYMTYDIAVPPLPKLLDPAKPEVAEIRSLSRGPFRFVILNDGTISVASMGRFLSKEELEARPKLLEEAQGYFLEELETLEIKPPAFELVTVYPSTHINQFPGVDKKLYGPYEAGEAALIPRENAEKFVKEHFASWEKLPPKPPEIPPAKPPRRPPPTRLKPDEVEEVWEQFVAFAKLAEIVEPLVYRDRFMETIRTSPTVANAIERARRLVSSIQRELRPPPPTAPPGIPLVPVPEDDVAEVYRRLGVPPGAPVSEAAFQTVWRAIQREKALEPPKGLIRSERDYLWREFADFLKKFDMDPERHRPEFDEVINPDFNLVENLEGVMKKVHELTDSGRWGPERWK